MIQDEQKRNVLSNLSGEKIRMGIDDDALAHIMSVLTDLYSDPELAVVREYSTNAFDSHVESGQTRPIEVTLPAPLSPFLRIRDYGVGLDAEDIRNIYSRYGTSTKRASNDVVGMLGLGCKSALTYTDQFTVTGYKDGVCTQISVSRSEDGSGHMTIVSQEHGDFPNGAEIIVPAKGANAFNDKAKSFFRFWTPGTVLVNGSEPERIDGLWLTDRILLSKDIDRDMVVMGNVAYPVDGGSNTNIGRQNYYSRYYKVFFVDIGDVAFTPAREALQMTKKTKETLERYEKMVEPAKKAKFEELMKSAKDHWGAVAIYVDMKKYGYTGDLPTFNGKPITISVKREDLNDPDFITIEAVKRYRGKSWNNTRSISLVETGYGYNSDDLQAKICWLVGWDAAGFTPYKRQKLDVWAAAQGMIVDGKHKYTKFVCTDKLPLDASLVNSADVHKWADVEATKVPREQKSNRLDGKPTGSYQGFVAGQRENIILAGNINTKNRVFWYHGSLYNFDHHCKLVQGEFPNCTIIMLPGNRIEKFKRDFPTSMEIGEYLKSKATAWSASLTREDKIAMQLHQSGETKLFTSFDAAEIADPDFVELIQIANRPITKIASEWNTWYRYGAKIEEPYKNPMERYPLAYNSYGSVSSKTVREHRVLYINAVYAATSEKEDS